MVALLTQGGIEQEISRLLDLQEKTTDEFEDLAQKAGDAENAYKMTYLQSLLEVEGPVELRKAQAEIVAKDQRLAYKIADVRLETCKERLRTIRTALEAYRSLNANVRHQV